MSVRISSEYCQSIPLPANIRQTSLACSAETSTLIGKEVNAIVSRVHEKARKILSDNMDALHRLAEYLLQKETITGEEFMRILKQDAPSA